MAKERTQIPKDVAAEVSFRHRHTCCVCNEPGKTIQIHHIDEDPTNHELDNLACLCLEHHNGTQVGGGFGRKLTAETVVRYRNDWVQRVAKMREEADRIAIGRMSATPPEIARADSAGDVEWTRPAEAMLEAYIRHLPELRRAAYERARPEWDSGVNSRMKNATTGLIDIFERVLVHLAAWYPPTHFGGKADQYFSEFTAARSSWHLDALSSHGHTGHGTGLGLDVRGAVLNDVEAAVAEMVSVLPMSPMHVLDPTWREHWEAAAAHPDADEAKAEIEEHKSIPPSGFKDDTIRVLVHLFKAPDIDFRDVGYMAQILRLDRSVVMYHLDRLEEAGLAESTGGNYLHGHVYWTLTSDGRRYAVEQGLIG